MNEVRSTEELFLDNARSNDEFMKRFELDPQDRHIYALIANCGGQTMTLNFANAEMVVIRYRELISREFAYEPDDRVDLANALIELALQIGPTTTEVRRGGLFARLVFGERAVVRLASGEEFLFQERNG